MLAKNIGRKCRVFKETVSMTLLYYNLTLNPQDYWDNDWLLCGFLEKKAGDIVAYRVFGIVEIDGVHTHSGALN